ncbi:MAG TPA: flagellar hook-associated protein FlgL [Gammaproteobacteria bacterium]|nr:flagellar hook-associated protein FlgL [Gammaproteobacteria bacterium]
MRISTTQIQQQEVNAILDKQAQLSKVQLQLSTGKRIVSPEDDPAGASQILDLNQALAITNQYTSNAETAKARLSLEESTLGDATNLLHAVRTLAVRANNASLSSQDRAAIALEVRERLNEVLSLANTKDSNGEYLFSGYQGQTQPFAATTGGTFSYSGDSGQRYLQISATRQVAVSDSGTDVFRSIPSGNGTFTTADNSANSGSGVIDSGSVTNPAAYVANNFSINFTSATTFDVVNTTTSATILSAQPYTSGNAISFNGSQVIISGVPASGDSFTVTAGATQDVFTTVQNMARVLETGGGSLAHITNVLSRTLTDVDQALNNIDGIRARTGSRLNAVESQIEINGAFSLQIQQTLSTVQDVDYTEAASRLNLQLVALQAAQQAFVKVQGLSLFNYL